MSSIPAAWLVVAADSIATVSATDDDGVTAGTATSVGTVISVRVSGGTAGTIGTVTLRWTTADGDTDERTLRFNVLDR